MVASDRNGTASSTRDLHLLWGAEAIGAEIGVGVRRTFHLLEKGAIPARKVGGRWVADRAKLHSFFRQEMISPSTNEQLIDVSKDGERQPRH